MSQQSEVEGRFRTRVIIMRSGHMFMPSDKPIAITVLIPKSKVDPTHIAIHLSQVESIN